MGEKFTDIARQRNEEILQKDKPSNPQFVAPKFNQSKDEESKKNSALFKTFLIVILTIAVFVIILIILRSSRGTEENQQDQNESQEGQEETSNQDEEESQTEEETSEEEANETIDASSKEDTDTAEDAPSESDFSEDMQSVGDSNVDDVTISGIKQESYDNFYRIIFTIEEGGDIPNTTAELKAVSNLILVLIHGISTDNSGITPGSGNDITGSVVSTVYHEVSTTEDLAKYSIGINKTTPFYLHTLTSPLRIVIDVKEQVISDENGQEFSFSTGQQTIEGDVSGNVISMSGVSYTGAGSVYRVIFKLGTIDSGSIPDARAQIVNYEGGKAIILILKNMNSDFAAMGNYDQDFPDSRVLGMKGSFSNNTSTYYIRLSGEREYKLYYRKAPAQILVDVK